MDRWHEWPVGNAYPWLRRNSFASLVVARLEKSLMSQPVGTRLRPRRARMVAWTDTEIVGGCCIDVQFHWDAGSLQGEVQDHAMIRVADDIVPTVRKKDGRRLGRDAQARSEFIVVLGLQIA